MFKNNGVMIANRFLECVFCEQLAKLRIKRLVYRFKNTSNPEIKEIVEYYKNNKTTAFQKIFPYSFARKYNEQDIELYFDGVDYFVYRNEKKLYLGHSFSNRKEVALYYNRLLIEQDIESPHRYLTNEFSPNGDDIVLDIGGAEGIFALDVVENCKKVFIFECDENWINALRKTFSDYSDKIIIINKFVDNYSDSTHVTLDDFIQDNQLQNEKIFVKIDAEGSELRIVEGMKVTLRNNSCRLAICSYHKKDDEKNLRTFFDGWKIQHSRGYMFFVYDFKIRFPYLRRGVLRIKK